MSKHADRLPYDEEADTEPVSPGGIQASESGKDFRHCFLGDAAACVEHVDAHLLIRTTAAHEKSTAGLGIFDGIADKIAKDSTEKQSIAYDGSSCRNRPDLDALLQGSFLVLVAGLPQQRLEADGRELHVLGMLAQAKSRDQLVELFGEAIDGDLTRRQVAQLRFRSYPDAKELVSTLDDLKWLPEIVTCDGKKQRLEIRESLWL